MPGAALSLVMALVAPFEAKRFQATEVERSQATMDLDPQTNSTPVHSDPKNVTSSLFEKFSQDTITEGLPKVYHGDLPTRGSSSQWVKGSLDEDVGPWGGYWRIMKTGTPWVEVLIPEKILGNVQAKDAKLTFSIARKVLGKSHYMETELVLQFERNFADPTSHGVTKGSAGETYVGRVPAHYMFTDTHRPSGNELERMFGDDATRTYEYTIEVALDN